MTPSTAIECLRMARALIEKPEHWAQGYYAFNKEGRTAWATGADAVKWCAVGALRWADGPEMHRAEAFLCRAIGRYIPEFNDDPKTTHAMIMAKFDEAIALAEKERA